MLQRDVQHFDMLWCCGFATFDLISFAVDHLLQNLFFFLSPSLFFRLWISRVRWGGQPHWFSVSTQLYCPRLSSRAASPPCCTWRRRSTFFSVFSYSVVHVRLPHSDCTTTFPYCTRWQRLTCRKAKLRLKNFGIKYFIFTPTIYQVVYCFLISCPVSVLQRLI